MENLGPLFEPPVEESRLWMLIVLLAAVVIAACVYVVIRGRLPSALSASALLLLPAVAYLLGDLNMLEESQTVEFCGSCHVTMSPIVEAMRDDGDTLAGSHYRRGAVPHATACYACHSGYGLWGDFEAKRAGVAHLINTVTGSYEFPIRKVGAFDISACRGCHAGAVAFREVEAHRDPAMQELLLAGEMSCAGTCHPAAHPDEALMGAHAKQVAAR